MSSSTPPFCRVGNWIRGRDDQTCVTDATCDHFRDLISARMDDELDEIGVNTLDSHVRSCASCSHYQDDAYALRRSLQMRAVAPVPADHTPSNAEINLVGSLRGVTMLRWALFVIGATLVVLNVGALVSVDSTASAHLNRHDAVFGTALGIGMLAVAAKPHRAIGLVPLTSAIAVLMGVVAVVDLVAGNANLLAESVHIVEFAGLVCLWVISGGPARFSQLVDHENWHLPRLLRN